MSETIRSQTGRRTHEVIPFCFVFIEKQTKARASPKKFEFVNKIPLVKSGKFRIGEK